jgi:hypothetical protein
LTFATTSQTRGCEYISPQSVAVCVTMAIELRGLHAKA